MNARLPWTASRRRAPCGWVLGQVFPRVHTLVRGQQWGKLERMCTAACIGRMRRMDAASRAALAAAEAEAVRAQAEGVADGGAAEAADGTWDLERHFDGMTVRRARVYGIDLLKDFEASEEQDDTVSEAASTAPPPASLPRLPPTPACGACVACGGAWWPCQVVHVAISVLFDVEHADDPPEGFHNSRMAQHLWQFHST